MIKEQISTYVIVVTFVIMYIYALGSVLMVS